MVLDLDSILLYWQFGKPLANCCGVPGGIIPQICSTWKDHFGGKQQVWAFARTRVNRPERIRGECSTARHHSEKTDSLRYQSLGFYYPSYDSFVYRENPQLICLKGSPAGKTI